MDSLGNCNFPKNTNNISLNENTNSNKKKLYSDDYFNNSKLQN